MKTKRLLYCLMACFAVVLCSCTKDFEDNRLQVPDADKVHVGIVGASPGVVVKEISFSSTSEQPITIKVPEWKGKVKARVGVNTKLIAAYNEVHKTNYVEFPSSMYTAEATDLIIQNDDLVYGVEEPEEPVEGEGEETPETKAEGDVTWNTTSNEFVITFNPVAAELDFTQQYILPVEMTSMVANSYVAVDPNATVLYLVLVPASAAAPGTEVSMTEANALVEQEISFVAASTLSEGLTVSIPAEGGDVLANMELALDLVDAYNADNGTSYPAFPESMVTVGDAAVLSDGQTESTSATLSFAPVMDDLDFGGTYLLPVKIASLNASPDFVIDAENNVIYLLLSAAPVDKSQWTTTASSTMGGEAGGNRSALALDGDINTYWHSDPSLTMPQWISVDIKAPRTFSGFEFTNRQDAGGGDAIPQNVTVEVSDDGSVWNLAGTFEFDHQGFPGSKMTYNFDEPVEGRYIRLTITSVWNGGAWTFCAELNPLFEE